MSLKEIFGQTRIVLIFVLLVSILFLSGCIGEKTPKQKKTYTIGILWMNPSTDAVKGFKDGMREFGYVEGKNVIYLYRNAMGDEEKARIHATELVAKNVDLLFVGSTPCTLIAKDATKGTDIPVLFTVVSDPVGSGIVQGIESSGNNLAGISSITEGSKRLELLFDILPNTKRLGVIYNPNDKSPQKTVAQFREVLENTNIELTEAYIQSPEEVEGAVRSLIGRVDVIMVPPDSMVMANPGPIIKASYEHGIPLGMPNRRGVEAGGLFAISSDHYELGKRVAKMADRVLKGTKPRDLPLEFPYNYIISINLKTAEKLNITIPQSVLKRADYIVE